MENAWNFYIEQVLKHILPKKGCGCRKSARASASERPAASKGRSLGPLSMPLVPVVASNPDMYTDPTCLLYGLDAEPFCGAASTEGASYSSSLDELIRAFHAAQINSRSRCDAGEWSDNKSVRKQRWVEIGISEHLIVPTLLTACMELDEASRVPAPEWVMDEDGDFVLCLAQDSVQMRPLDAGLESKLQSLLSQHRSLILKPVYGTNSRGVMRLSLEDDPMSGMPLPNGEPRLQSSHPALADGMVWVCAPSKSPNTIETAVCLERELWFAELVLRNPDLCGPRREFLCEPSIPHDQELCVLAVCGGRVQVLAGRSNCMERLVMLADHETLVAASDFAPPSCRKHVLSAEARNRHTAMVLEQTVAGDEAGRTVHEVIRDVVSKIGLSQRIAAYRVDFFVRWGIAGQAATLWLNEVEHSFGAGSMIGWWGAPFCDYALRVWVLGGDPAQRARFEKEYGSSAILDASEATRTIGGVNGACKVLGFAEPSCETVIFPHSSSSLSMLGAVPAAVLPSAPVVVAAAAAALAALTTAPGRSNLEALLDSTSVGSGGIAEPASVASATAALAAVATVATAATAGAAAAVAHVLGGLRHGDSATRPGNRLPGPEAATRWSVWLADYKASMLKQ
ncbi:hypothetical protein AB1Y20_012934 [Prymnesium parvum]|uniref:Inositol-1,3,4-trisphosphate 5/6-kinase n=1 Tax=Prymnesium parvum TaxID=97485 RepID=A0AB34IM60_PRYPA